MKRISLSPLRRPLCVCMALALTLGLLPARALAAEITPACDETYYATLDAYGALVKSSVVKSYRTCGSPVITDYGSYDKITNLTDGRAPSASEGEVRFDLADGAPGRFYFEGETAQPYEDFPWTLSVSYALNGVPTPAEELAGRSGVVEITLDALPNPGASEYSRNNLVLTALSAFNGDELLSLEAPGAQVQLLGNLYCVLYAVLPGEEQHFTIRVGSEDFSYGGMVFLAVPATLEQLEQVEDLRRAKEEGEDSYRAIGDSLEAILDSLDGMSGSLNATASGLDQLNKARASISGGKSQVYDSVDAALEASGGLTAALEPAGGHMESAGQALADTAALLDKAGANAAALSPALEEARGILEDLRGDLEEYRGLLEDPASLPANARRLTANLSGNLGRLESSLNTLQTVLGGAQGISSVPGMTVGGMTAAEIRSAVAQAQAAHAQFEQAQAAGLFPAEGTFEQFLVAGAGLDAATAAQLSQLYAKSQAPGFEDELEQLDTANGLIGGVNDKLNEVNGLIGGLAQPAANVMGDLAAVTDSLESLTELAADMMEELDGSGSSGRDAVEGTLDTLDQAAALAIRVSGNADAALEHIQELTGLADTYEPQLQQALADARTLTDSVSAGLTALTDAARATEELARTAGPELDQGTQQTLSALSSALRKSTAGLGQTDTIRSALDTIDNLVDEQWTSHAGGENNLLLMDAGAAPESITDSRNQGTASIQYVMRTQEITERAAGQEPAEEAAGADGGTFWSRVKSMFQDIWTAITGIF